jgi:hypothetical protein
MIYFLEFVKKVVYEINITMKYIYTCLYIINHF